MSHSAMACFHLLRSGYNMEVMIRLSYGYGTDTILVCLFILLVSKRACDSYFDSYIIFFLFVTLLIVNHINCVNCINVREYHGYSLTANKSLS